MQYSCTFVRYTFSVRCMVNVSRLLWLFKILIIVTLGSASVCMVENSVDEDRVYVSCVLLLVLSKFSFSEIYLYLSL